MSDSFATLWTVAGQVPLSMGFSRQKYWSRLPFLSPGGLPDTQGLNPSLPHCGQILYHWATTGITASLRSLLKASGAEAARTQVSWTPGSTAHCSTSVLNLFFNQDINNFAFFSSTCKNVQVYTILTHTHKWEILNRDYIGREINTSRGMYLCIIIIFKQ